MQGHQIIESADHVATGPEIESLGDLMLPVFRVQLVRETGVERIELEGPADVAQIISHYLEHEDLDVKNRVIGIHTVSIGTLCASLVSAREVFKAAILCNAASIILAHNHPSGDLTPSPEDIQVTKHLRDAGKLLDIEVLDHVIVGEYGAHCSLKRSGHI
jgi:DNA repair protein RadC